MIIFFQFLSLKNWCFFSPKKLAKVVKFTLEKQKNSKEFPLFMVEKTTKIVSK
jgi:hypothetical protein